MSPPTAFRQSAQSTIEDDFGFLEQHESTDDDPQPTPNARDLYTLVNRRSTGQSITKVPIPTSSPDEHPDMYSKINKRKCFHPLQLDIHVISSQIRFQSGIVEHHHQDPRRSIFQLARYDLGRAL